jgi:RimJ/RimL family protein N-acetyltransferase
MSEITIRPFEATEWIHFRDFRLHALKAAPGVFVTSYQETAARSPEEWQAILNNPGHRVFGLFDSGHLIGITAALTWLEDESGETAMMGMSFILPEYRRRGLSRLLYQARLDWIKGQSQFKRIIISHRVSNEQSRHAIQAHGFLPMRRVPTTWPDGETEDAIIYELVIPTP